MSTQRQHRVISLLVYAIALAAVQYLLVDTGLAPNENAIWLYNGIAGLLFGSRLLNPHFTPPADAATNGFVALASIIAGSLTVASASSDAALLWTTALFCGVVSLLALSVLLVRAPTGLEARPGVRIADQVARRLGSPNVIYTVVIIVAVWLFHRDRPVEVVAIMAVWTAVVALKPVEALLSIVLSWRKEVDSLSKDDVVGEIAAHQSPGIVLIRQHGKEAVKRGTPIIVADDRGPWMLGLALNYVGRDEGNLLRALTVPLPHQLHQHAAQLSRPKGAGVALSISMQNGEVPDIAEIQSADRLCGVVDTETSLDTLQFEVIDDGELSEGRLVEARIRNHTAIFQIIDGVTREEVVQQKNKYGYPRATARKIGQWDAGSEKFVPVTWLPRLNDPVFLMETTEMEADAHSVGHFPDTNYGVGIEISEAVTHNTAILGILGIGKSFLGAELVERMIASGIKVICLDLTNQYADLLSDFIDPSYEERKREDLAETEGRGDVQQSKEEGGSVNAFFELLVEQLREFADPDNERYLRIYNPASFEVWKQTGFKDFKTGDAAMASLTPCEITALLSEAALLVAQELGMSDQGRICLVYEEAHSLVPEWNSVAAEGDKAATSRSARAILQGRKYGLGCLLITQRTANVTKTILNQCNSIFAMRTFDDTGKDFLSNYIGGDYASVLPALSARHAVFFGKASTSENPVLIRLNDREAFLATFRAA